ncbi:hypothetical protein ABIC51_008132 [Burkholderia sp. 572]
MAAPAEMARRPYPYHNDMGEPKYSIRRGFGRRLTLKLIHGWAARQKDDPTEARYDVTEPRGVGRPQTDVIPPDITAPGSAPWDGAALYHKFMQERGIQVNRVPNATFRTPRSGATTIAFLFVS